MKIISILIIIFGLINPLIADVTFYGGPVNDAIRGQTLLQIKMINQNHLNQFNAIKSTADEQLAVLEAISRVLGVASPSEMNSTLVIPEDSHVNELASAITKRFKDSPKDFILYDSMTRYKAMNQRIRGYREYLNKLSESGSENLTITERQRLKAELGFLESRIKLDRDIVKSTGDAELLMMKQKKAASRARRYANQKLDESLR